MVQETILHAQRRQARRLEIADAVKPHAWSGDGVADGSLNFDADQIGQQQARALSEHYRRVLMAMTKNPEAGHHFHSWIETSPAANGFRPDEESPDLAIGFVARFERRAAQIPDAVAVEDGVRFYTYEALNRAADRLAAALRARGVGMEDRVGLLLERGFEMVLGMLASLKAWAAYVPLDPSYPVERLRWMITDANPVLLLVLPSTTGIIQTPVPWVLVNSYETDEGPVAPLSPRAHPRQAAYLIYTSGSTGRPKGALIEHAALTHFCLAVTDEYGLAPNDRVLQFCSMSFDMSVREIFPTLLAGAALIIARHDHGLTGPELERLISGRRLSVIILPTAFWHQWVVSLGKISPCLRILDVGGEQADLSRLEKWQRLAPPSSRWVNTYGPTETTVVASWYTVRSDQAPPPTRLPIGSPLPRTTIHVLDAFLNLAPIGTPGEIVIGGSGLGRGYHRAPSLSALSWIPDPLAGKTGPGSRLYRTGDLGRWSWDGINLEFLGRRDKQRKLRGYRIELGEVEAALRGHPSVQEVVVDIRADASGSDRLVAWYLAEPDTSAETLTVFLESALPAPMIPDQWMALRKFPITPSGKINRRALPIPDSTRTTAWLAPRSLMEKRLARIWETVLDVRPIGVRDNFFKKGGHSLKAVMVLSLIETHLGRRLPVGILYRHPSIESLAAWLEETRAPDDSPLVLLRSGKQKPACYLVHPAGGQIHWYLNLAYALAEGYPIYGIQTPLSSYQSHRGQAISTLCTTYRLALQRQDPDGVFLLAGWSSGGQIAFELASQLEATGCLVKNLVLIDSLGPGHQLTKRQETTSALPFPLHIWGGLEKLGRKNLPMDQKKSLESQLPQILKVLRQEDLIPPGTSIAFYQHLLRLYQAQNSAVRAYRPWASYKGKVTLIRSKDTSDGTGQRERDPTLGWQSFCQQPIRLFDLPCGHFELLAAEGVGALASFLEKDLP